MGRLLAGKLISRFLVTIAVFTLIIISVVSNIQAQANSKDCIFWIFNCQDKTADKAINDIFVDIGLEETKNLSDQQKDEIRQMLRSSDKQTVEQGFEELFNLTVKEDYNLYIKGRATKENTDRLRKFYNGISSARRPIEREWSPMVNSWGMLNNGVSFGSFIVSNLFLDIQTQLPDVFGKFDYTDTSTSTSDKATQALSLNTGGPLKLNGIATVNLNQIYYQLLILVIPLFGLYLLVKYATLGWYEWQVLAKMISGVLAFYVFIVIAPNLVSVSTLFTNTATLAMQQSFTSSNVVSECENDRTLLCAYRASFSAQANKEAIFARADQFYTFEEDSIKAVSNLSSEIFTNFIPLLLYTLNVIFGLLVLMLWKGSVLFLLVNMIFMVLLLPFALLNPVWRLNWFNKMIKLQITVFAFTLCFNLATQLVLSLSTNSFAFWTISLVFLVASFLIFQAMPMINEIFNINLRLKLNPETSSRNLIESAAEKIKSSSGYNRARRAVRGKLGNTKIYKKAHRAKEFVQNFGLKKSPRKK
ncbi:MAG: hypothetical protein AAGF07_02855 [Patescibacteria group bacterium]